MTSEDYIELIPRYLSGNASDSEVKLLEEWVLSSAENKATFLAFKKAWILSGMKAGGVQVDAVQEWQALSTQLFPEAKTIALPPRRTFFLRIAAAVAVLLVAVFLMVQYLGGGDYMELATQNQIEENLLPDGSQISMNQYSSVVYAPRRDKQYRRVELSGDAFFEVERDTARPFVIQAHDLEIEVLGTAFYVDAREDQPEVQVIVQSGTVSVKAGDARVVLNAGEIGIYDKASGALSKQTNEDQNYMAWKTDVLIFEQTTLERVVFDLNRKFHARISISNPELNTCELTATYEGKSLEAILKIIEKTLNIKAVQKDEEIIFTGKSCG